MERITYEEWLKHVDYTLRKRYKIQDIATDNDGLLLKFQSGFTYYLTTSWLKTLYQSDGLLVLFRDIERECVNSIMNY